MDPRFGERALRTDFEIAELVWDAADSCLTAAERSMLCVMLHSGEPLNVIRAVVESVDATRFALPYNAYAELTEWLRWLPDVAEQHRDFATIATIRVLVAGIGIKRRTSQSVPEFGDATLCYFILDDAGASDAPRAAQMTVLRQWLAHHVPGPSLRFDLHECGFGELLVPRTSHLS